MQTQNTIIIPDKQSTLLCKWIDKNKDIIKTQFYPFLLDGVIILQNWQSDIDIVPCQTVKIAFNIQDIQNSNYFISLVIDSYLGNDANKMQIGTSDFIIDQQGQISQQTHHNNNIDSILLDSLVYMFLYINAYLFNYKQDVSTIEKKTAKNHTQLIKNKYICKKVQYINKIYTISGKIYQNKLPKCRQWHIDSWNVKGHLRHLQNGKTIYIKPYTKGNKNNTNKKVYSFNNKGGLNNDCK